MTWDWHKQMWLCDQFRSLSSISSAGTWCVHPHCHPDELFIENNYMENLQMDSICSRNLIMLPGKRNTTHNKSFTEHPVCACHCTKREETGWDEQKHCGTVVFRRTDISGAERCDKRIYRSSQDLKGSQHNTKLQDVKSVLFSIVISPAHGLEPGT